MPPRKFFISYAHAAAEERQLAAWLHDALITNGHTAFIDTGIPPGTRWADEIERRIHWCDFLIVLLSAVASASDMVTEEVKRARDRHRTHGSPVIIPLRVRYDGDLGSTLSALLKPLQWACWESDNDSPRIHLHNCCPHNLRLVPPVLLRLPRYCHVLRQWLRLCLAVLCCRMTLCTLLDPTMSAC